MEEQEQDAEFIRDLQDFFLPYSTAGKTAPLSSLSLIPLTLIPLSLYPFLLSPLLFPYPQFHMAGYFRGYRHRYYISVHIIPVYVPVELPAEYPVMELGGNSF